MGGYGHTLDREPEETLYHKRGSMKKNTHVHKYRRVLLGGTKVVRRDGRRYLEKCPGTEVFKCMIPGCPHYLSRELAVGRDSVCWKCGETLTLNMENTTLKNPTHLYCRKTREDKVA